MAHFCMTFAENSTQDTWKYLIFKRLLISFLTYRTFIPFRGPTMEKNKYNVVKMGQIMINIKIRIVTKCVIVVSKFFNSGLKKWFLWKVLIGFSENPIFIFYLSKYSQFSSTMAIPGTNKFWKDISRVVLLKFEIILL